MSLNLNFIKLNERAEKFNELNFRMVNLNANMVNVNKKSYKFVSNIVPFTMQQTIKHVTLLATLFLMPVYGHEIDECVFRFSIYLFC